MRKISQSGGSPCLTHNLFIFFQVEELLANEDYHEKTTSRSTAEEMQTASINDVETPIQRAEKAFPGTIPKEHVLSALDGSQDSKKKQGDDENLAILYSDNQQSFEGMILWTKRLQAVPYRQWTVGASTALDHWIAKRVLGLSEETWLALLEGDSPELMGRGRDIVMARHALFPETILDAEIAAEGEEPEQVSDSTDKEIDALLSTLWSDAKDGGGGSFDSSFSFDSSPPSDDGDELADELQAWRKRNVETQYDNWTDEKKQEFNSWLQTFVSSLVPESSLEQVNLEETRRNILASPPQTKESANEFWNGLRDETSAEVFLQDLLSSNDEGSSKHPFFELEYSQQLDRLVNLGTIGEIANEYASEADRSKFLSRYGDYLLEGVNFDHLVLDPNGSIQGSDLGPQLLETYNINKSDRFSLQKIPYGADEFGTDASGRARSLYRAWNRLKAGRANYEEKLFQRGRLGLQYEEKKKK